MNRISFLASTSLTALGLAATAADAQQFGSVRGTVSDSVTGAPIVGARVAVLCDGCYGREGTDSLGRYRIGKIAAGTYKMEFHCPSRTMLGRELAQRTIDVTVGKESVVDVRVPPGACFEPAYSERTGIFRGVWTPGFESSAFIPCADSVLGLTDTLLPGKRLVRPKAWAQLSVAAQKERLQLPPAPPDSHGKAHYFVVWRGTLKGPGGYGHLGVSEFSMVVDSILSIRASQPNDCALP